MRKISSGWDLFKREEQFETLLKFFGQAKSAAEIQAVIETLITPSEKAAIAQRLMIIILLFSGAKYADIELDLRVSPSTINKTLDLYHKHGQHNRTFTAMLSKFKFQPKKPKIKSEGFDPQSKSFQIGTRAIIREREEDRERRETVK